jgi:hypothetical protein
MSLIRSPWGMVFVCIAITAAIIFAKELLWHLGVGYWVVLSLLGISHLVVSAAVFADNSGNFPIKLGISFLLITGQWWVLEMIAMQVIWRLHGFAP